MTKIVALVVALLCLCLLVPAFADEPASGSPSAPATTESTEGSSSSDEAEVTDGAAPAPMFVEKAEGDAGVVEQAAGDDDDEAFVQTLQDGDDDAFNPSADEDSDAIVPSSKSSDTKKAENPEEKISTKQQ